MFFVIDWRILVIFVHCNRPASFSDDDRWYKSQLLLEYVGVLQETQCAKPILVSRFAGLTSLHVGVIRIIRRVIGAIRMGYEEHLVE